MDGILALDLWDLVIEVFHSSLHPPSIQGNRCCNEQSGKRSNTRTKKRPIRDDLRLTNVDHVTSNAQRSSNQDDYKRQKSDNETMCPVPTELRLIGYLTESIWTPKSKSNMLIPKTNLPTSWRKGSFTREEWNHLSPFVQQHGHLTVCICHFSSTSSSETMPKRSKTVDWSPTALSSSTSYSLGYWQQRARIWISMVWRNLKPESLEHRIEFSSAAIRCKSELQYRDSCC